MKHFVSDKKQKVRPVILIPSLFGCINRKKMIQGGHKNMTYKLAFEKIKYYPDIIK